MWQNLFFSRDQGFGEKKENIKWLEYVAKFVFEVHIEINYIECFYRLFVIFYIAVDLLTVTLRACNFLPKRSKIDFRGTKHFEIS